MEYRNLGKSGLQVSVVGLGCNNFGGKVDAVGTAAVVNKAIDMGVTFFDTADVYNRGASEECMAAALKPHRRNVTIATKGGFRMGEGPYYSGASRHYLMNAVDASLKRLDTDYIDLYQLHVYDPRTPIEETLRALEDIVKSGKVRYVGCTNFAAWQVVEAVLTAKNEHVPPFVSASNQYSLMIRNIEADVAPVCVKYGLGYLPYYPLYSGFLTGKYRKDAPIPEGARLAAPPPGTPRADRVLTDENYTLLGALEDFATARGHTILELAFGWLASQPFVSSVIAGATSPEQMEENAKAGDWRLSADEMKEVGAILNPAPAGAPGR